MNGFMNPQKGHNSAEGGGDKQDWSFVECEEQREKFSRRKLLIEFNFVE